MIAGRTRASPARRCCRAGALSAHHYRGGSRVGQAIQVIHPLVPPAGEHLLSAQDPEGSVDGGKVGGEVGAGMPADGPVDQCADQLSPGNTFGLRGPVQSFSLAFGEVDVRPLHTPHNTPSRMATLVFSF